MRRLWLVRHGRSLPDPSRPADEWGLDPLGTPALAALRWSGRLPVGARWFCSSERKAVDTARSLADASVTVLDELGEHRRGARWFDSEADFQAAVRRAFADPATPAVPEWEPLTSLRDRLVPAVRRLLAEERDDVVLVGHGTAWTLLVAELTGAEPDLDRWAELAMPDLIVVEVQALAGD